MKWKKGWMRGAGLGLVLGAVASCKYGSPEQTKLTYMPDMADAPTVKPQQDYLELPQGSVPMYSILYPKNEEDAAKLLHNPFVGDDMDALHLDEGAFLYSQVCVPRHGAEAKGDGSISDLFPRPPDITAQAYAEKADGFFFHRITFGSAIMPPQGDKLDPAERWKVIMYLRSLQNQAGNTQHGHKAEQP